MTQVLTETLITKVEVDMETLGLAQSLREHPLVRHRAQEEIIEAVIKGLDPEDRERFEAYQKVNDPCYSEEYERD